MLQSFRTSQHACSSDIFSKYTVYYIPVQTVMDVITVYRHSWLIVMFHIMMTSSNGAIFRVAGLLCGEFTGTGEFPAQRPVTQSFDVSFDLRLNKRLSKQPGGWWFETPPWSLWRQCNDICRADFRFATSQWETVLLCNDVSHRLDSDLESALICISVPLGIYYWCDGID